MFVKCFTNIVQFDPHSSLGARCPSYAHSTDGETQAGLDYMTCPGTYS